MDGVKKDKIVHSKLNICVPAAFKRVLEEESELTGVPISWILTVAGRRYLRDCKGDRELLAAAKLQATGIEVCGS